jgi:ABC-2 type transport system permease protein
VLLLILPPDFSLRPSGAPTLVRVYGSAAKPQDTPIALAAVRQVFDDVSFRAAGHPPALALDFQVVDGREVRYVDFLVPGIIAFSIMSTGINSVAFAIVAMKKTGVIRRLMATPMRVTDFMMAQVVSRMMMSLVQVAVLLGVATVAFKFHASGNVLAILLVSVLGSGIFIAMGFAVAGTARDEDTVPAVTNLVTLPMMILSGIFFPLSAVPGWLRAVSQLLPLTYLADALRSITVDGASLWDVRVDLLGIVAWLLLAVVVATRVFRWEGR